MSGGSTILIIDDDVDYACLLQVAFEETRISRPIELVHDGGAALERLGPSACKNVDGSLPCLILLDLRMPGISGLEVLGWIRHQEHLAQIPVVVFTGLEAGKESIQAAALGASAIHVKPFSYKELINEVKGLREAYLDEGTLKHAA